jgi:hypothetical protein
LADQSKEKSDVKELGEFLCRSASDLYGREGKVSEIVEEVRRAIAPLILPDAAKVLTAIATDVMTGVQSRNNRADVKDACDALRKAIAMLEAVGPDLDR